MSFPDSKQTSIWKKMTLSAKYELFAANIHQLREFKRIGLKMKFPNDNPAAIEAKLSRLWLHARP